MTSPFADDTAILTRSKSLARASRFIQIQLYETEKWLQNGESSPDKSIHETFNLRPGDFSTLNHCGTAIPK